MIKKLPIVIDFNKSNSKNKKVGKILFHNFKIKENNGMITINYYIQPETVKKIKKLV